MERISISRSIRITNRVKKTAARICAVVLFAYIANFQKQKLKSFRSSLSPKGWRGQGRGALAGSWGSAPSRSPQGAKSLALAKRRMGGKTVQWTVLPWETLVGGLPMGARSASMTAQSNSTNYTHIYLHTWQVTLSIDESTVLVVQPIYFDIYIRVRCELLLCAGMDVRSTSIGKPLTVVSPRKNSPPDCFFSPSCALLAQGISRPAGRDLGRCPKTLRGLCPSTPPPLRKVDEPF